jgi:type I site-specific restriction endonuclease
MAKPGNRKRGTEEEADKEHPSEDHTSRHSVDQLLRRKGWKIEARPRKGEPVWSKLGKSKPQSVAERSLDTNDLADAEYLDALESGGME